MVKPSRPRDFHPRPLTVPGVKVSLHPARATPNGLPAVPGQHRAPPDTGWPDGAVRVTHPLRSLGVPPAPRYYEVVRPSPAHRYFRPRGSPAWAFSLGMTGKVLTFCTEA